MKLKKTKSKDFPIADLWPLQNHKENKHQRHKSTVRSRNGSVDYSLDQYQTISNYHSGPHKNYTVSLNRPDSSHQVKQLIKQKIMEVTENHIIPFIGNKMNQLEREVKSQISTIHEKIKQQQLQIKEIKAMKNKEFKDTGTSPLRETDRNNLSSGRFQSLEDLNSLLEVLSISLEKEHNKRQSQMQTLNRKLQRMNEFNEESSKQLTNITQIFNQNFVELDEKINHLEKRYQTLVAQKLKLNRKSGSYQ